MEGVLHHKSKSANVFKVALRRRHIAKVFQLFKGGTVCDVCFIISFWGVLPRPQPRGQNLALIGVLLSVLSSVSEALPPTLSGALPLDPTGDFCHPGPGPPLNLQTSVCRWGGEVCITGIGEDRQPMV